MWLPFVIGGELSNLGVDVKGLKFIGYYFMKLTMHYNLVRHLDIFLIHVSLRRL